MTNYPVFERARYERGTRLALWALAAFVVTTAGDIVTTALFQHSQGFSVRNEGDPLVAWEMTRVGKGVALGAPLLLTAVLVVLLLRVIPSTWRVVPVALALVLGTAAVVHGVTVVHNVVQYVTLPDRSPVITTYLPPFRPSLHPAE